MKLNYVIISVLFILLFGCQNDQDGTKGQSFRSKIIYPELPDSIIASLQNGDVVIRKGDGPLSFHLSRSTGENYTHCGIIFNHGNTWGVIHTLGSDASSKGINGVQTQSLTTFVKQSADSVLFICRPIFKKNIGDSIVAVAKKYLNKKVPFDYGFSMLSNDKYYCTELLYYIFKEVNNGKNIFDITKKSKSYILMFSTFFNRQNFKPIFYLKN